MTSWKWKKFFRNGGFTRNGLIDLNGGIDGFPFTFFTLFTMHILQLNAFSDLYSSLLKKL